MQEMTDAHSLVHALKHGELEELHRRAVDHPRVGHELEELSLIRLARVILVLDVPPREGRGLLERRRPEVECRIDQKGPLVLGWIERVDA